MNGVLAVARSFGDVMYKNYITPNGNNDPMMPSHLRETLPDGLWNLTTQPVISKPDVCCNIVSSIRVVIIVIDI